MRLHHVAGMPEYNAPGSSPRRFRQVSSQRCCAQLAMAEPVRHVVNIERPIWIRWEVRGMCTVADEREAMTVCVQSESS